MKKIIVVVLCLLSIGVMAQKKKPTRRSTPARRSVSTSAKNTKGKKATPPASKPAPVQQSTTMSTQGAIDTSKKVKPFERPLDGYYKKNNIINARVTAYPNLREADVMFAKRVWREIDTREKMNKYISSPKSSLITILVDAIGNGELTAYDPTPGSKEDPNGDSFAHPLTPAQAKGRLADSSLVDDIDKNTGEKIGSHMVAGNFNPDSVIKFRIKEDWVFDKQRSVFEPRIIGIAPMMKPKVAAGTNVELDYIPVFWVYFPEARPILATKEVISRSNDATGLSYDDIFMKRLFTSYVVKVSNEKDERIKDYAQGIDKLYESEKVKKSLMDWELNLWQY